MGTTTTTAPVKKALPTEGKPGYKHTKLGWIPEEWEVKPLGKIGKWRGGGTPSKAEKSYWTGEIPWVSSRDVKKRRLTDTELHISESGLANSSSVLLPAGSLIVVTRSGILRHTLPACVNEVPMSINQDIKAMVPIRLADSDYVQMLFEGWNKYLLRSCYKEGTTVESIDFETLKSFRVPWPLEPERLRIVTVLRAWDRAIATAQQLLAAQQQRKRGLMQELLSGKKRFPGFEGKWKEVRLGELGDTYNGLSGKNGADFGEGKPYITYLNIFNNSRIDINQVDYVRVGLNERQSRVQRGDLFFTVSSETPDEVGMASVMLDDVEEMYLNSFCFGFRLNSFKVLLPEFARYYLRSIAFRRELNKLAQGATRFNLSKKQLVKISLFLPEVAEQLAIADCLSATEREIKTLNNQIVHLTTQKRGLMQVLLTGTVRLNTQIQ